MTPSDCAHPASVRSCKIRPDYDKGDYHNLPCGDYVLSVAERNFPFTISAKSPAVIDLGEIRLGQNRPKP